MCACALCAYMCVVFLQFHGASFDLSFPVLVFRFGRLDTYLWYVIVVIFILILTLAVVVILINSESRLAEGVGRRSKHSS